MMRNTLISLCLLLCGCAAMADLPERPVVSPRELNTHPEQYDGQDVTVRGYVVLGSNGRSLYESRDRLEAFDRAFRAQTPGFDPSDFYLDCLTLLNARLLEENRSLFNGQTITVRGRFQRNYLDGNVLDLQACGGPTALILDEQDARRVFQDLQAQQ